VFRSVVGFSYQALAEKLCGRCPDRLTPLLGLTTCSADVTPRGWHARRACQGPLVADASTLRSGATIHAPGPADPILGTSLAYGSTPAWLRTGGGLGWWCTRPYGPGFERGWFGPRPRRRCKPCESIPCSTEPD